MVGTSSAVLSYLCWAGSGGYIKGDISIKQVGGLRFSLRDVRYNKSKEEMKCI